MDYIYLDHAATTPLHPKVKEVMFNSAEKMVGNPSSIHSYGREVRKVLDGSRRQMAQSIGANEREIIFTSGGTEANNLALIGVALANQSKGKHIITSQQEHHSVLDAADYLTTIGFEVTYLPVDKNGRVLVQDIANALRKDTILVSIMYANNETGVIQPIVSIGELLKTHPTYFHTDAVQAFGLLQINVEELGIDMLTTSAHKINGPTGIGFLYVDKKVRIQPLQHGGEQERKHRPGTENVLGIIGFQKAIEIRQDEYEEKEAILEAHKEVFIKALIEYGIDFEINGEINSTLASIINISFPNTKVEMLLQNLDLSKIAASSGSACTAGTYQSSHVLAAMFGQDNDRTTNSIRFSFGMNQSEEQMIDAAERVAKIINRITK